MKKEKTEQYTFAPEEKQILDILSAFEEELQEKLQESKDDIERVKYYEKFSMQNIDFSNIFVTTQKDVDGNITYHVYCGSANNEILSIDSDGKLEILEPELEKYLSEINLDEVMAENEKDKTRLKGISEKSTPEEFKKELKNKSENKIEDDKKEEDSEQQEVEEDLREDGKDLKLTKTRGIKDKYFTDRMPEVLGDSTENMVAYSDTLNGFIILSKIDGKWQENPNIQPTTTAWRRTILSVDEKGEQIEKNMPYGLMKTNNPKKEIAVTVGQYGYIDIQTVDVLPCNERLARGVRTDGEGMDMEENYETRKNFETEGTRYPHEVAHNAEEVIEDQQEFLNDSSEVEISPDDYIPNTDKKWRDLMDETGESFTELVSRYKREIETGKTEEQAVNIIEEDYENISHEKNR